MKHHLERIPFSDVEGKIDIIFDGIIEPRGLDLLTSTISPTLYSDTSFFVARRERRREVDIVNNTNVNYDTTVIMYCENEKRRQSNKPINTSQYF